MVAFSTLALGLWRILNLAQKPRGAEHTMSKQTKPSIVFAHGLWADGSCFGKLIPALQDEGHEVMASQHGLNSLKSDVDWVTHRQAGRRARLHRSTCTRRD
jgi:hypothetical protein